MRLGIAMAINTPSHRLIFGLVHDVHFVYATVARYARNTPCNVHGMIEVNVIWKTVNSHPVDRFAGPPTVVNRLQLFAFRVNRRKCRTGSRRFWTMAIDTGLSRRNSRMCGFLDRIVAIATVHLEFACVQRMTERNRLLGSVPNIERNRTRRA